MWQGWQTAPRLSATVADALSSSVPVVDLFQKDVFFGHLLVDDDDGKESIKVDTILGLSAKFFLGFQIHMF